MCGQLASKQPLCRRLQGACQAEDRPNPAPSRSPEQALATKQEGSSVAPGLCSSLGPAWFWPNTTLSKPWRFAAPSCLGKLRQAGMQNALYSAPFLRTVLFCHHSCWCRWKSMGDGRPKLLGPAQETYFLCGAIHMGKCFKKFVEN